ncbi:hypothetical protein [Streptomyces tibetensis]|uniref:hypothetical protein n=1 Tax=Streptomyces tibetensis TaxID=2382123 RepID=UPI0033DE474B
MYVAKLLGRFGGVRVLASGLLIQGVGTVVMFALPQDVNLVALLATSSVMGLGHVFSVVSFLTVMTTGVTEEDQGVVGGLSQLPQYVAAIGVSGLSAIAAARTGALASGADPSHADILGGLHAGMVTAGVGRPRRRPARRRSTARAGHGVGRPVPGTRHRSAPPSRYGTPSGPRSWSPGFRQPDAPGQSGRSSGSTRNVLWWPSGRTARKSRRSRVRIASVS